jgi:hypothetical protein
VDATADTLLAEARQWECTPVRRREFRTGFRRREWCVGRPPEPSSSAGPHALVIRWVGGPAETVRVWWQTDDQARWQELADSLRAVFSARLGLPDECPFRAHPVPHGGTLTTGIDLRWPRGDHEVAVFGAVSDRGGAIHVQTGLGRRGPCPSAIRMFESSAAHRGASARRPITSFF